ncbi:MAG: cation transporter [Methylophaga sp.]|nr:cation transporter [Methylophaga sp.]
MTKGNCGLDNTNASQQTALAWLLAINGAMFLFEFTAGLLASSSALTADSLDMFADAAVYAVVLYAVGRTLIDKARVASLSGILQILLALMVIVEVVRRLIFGSDPEATYIVLVGLVALIANLICLAIIAKYKKGEIHMWASWIFAANDVIANIGVVLSGFLVMILNSRIPDLMIGLIVGLVVMRGGMQIIREARQTMDDATQ